MLNILLVDDDLDFCSAVTQMLESLGHSVTAQQTLATALTALENAQFDHVLLDFMLPDGSGVHVIDALQKASSPPSITLISGHPAVKNIIAGLCGPGISYLTKPLRLQHIRDQIEKPSDKRKGNHDIHFDCLVGESKAMKSLYDMIEKVAKTRANVMLLGESGVGKELVAQAIHSASGTTGPLIAVNCGAIARELIGSELFGHEKGAFTGAVAQKLGVFERAKNGNLFLDEVTEMPIEDQPTLLRVLESNQLTRVGGSKVIETQCRVISATNRNPQQLAADNVIREDLYFRLAVFPIDIPPLRNRQGDIRLLARYFLDQLNEEHQTEIDITEDQLRKLESYDWPGNVRELRHTLHRAFILTGHDESTLTLPDSFGSPFSNKTEDSSINAGQTIEDVERELIRVTLEQVDNDKPKAAEMLGISLKTLYNRLNKYEN